MKFGIATKLGLMTCGVTLVVTAALGMISWREGKKNLLRHELVDLADEAELRGRDLDYDFRYLRKDVRDFASPPRQPVQTLQVVTDLIERKATTAQVVGLRDRLRELLDLR